MVSEAGICQHDAFNNSPISFWNISPADDAPISKLIYQYLPNGQENVIKYVDFSLHFRLWYLKLASVSMRHLTPVSLGGMSFSVGPL